MMALHRGPLTLLFFLAPFMAISMRAQAPKDPAPAPAEAPEIHHYDVTFDARIRPSERIAEAAIRIGEGADAVRWLQLRIDPDRHSDFQGDGVIESGDGVLRWRPPEEGGVLRYTFRIDQLRSSTSYDARCAEHWALFRGGDLFPPARVRTLVGAQSRSKLRIRVPDGWSVATPYERLSSSTFAVADPERGFDRPVGWLLAGRLGIVRERIAGSRIAVAGPVGQGMRRQDMLAFLRWTLPDVRDALGPLPERILVVGAADPMWRGGLSGPRSVYMHADRPLIAPDGTSPLLHEIVHTTMRARAGEDGDWIVEGLAELYSLEVLRRSRTISKRRFRRALARLAEKGRSAVTLGSGRADAIITARAVGVLHNLDAAIREATEQEASLDDVVVMLGRDRGATTTADLRRAVKKIAGRDLVPTIPGEQVVRP